MRITKTINAVEPSHTLKIQYMQILGNAESELMKCLMDHYEVTIPKLEEEFTKLFDTASQTLPPVEKRLVVVKLLHFRNDLIKDRRQTATNKINRLDPNEQTHPPRGGPRTNSENRWNQGTRNKTEDWPTNTEETWDRDPLPQRERRGRDRGRRNFRNFRSRYQNQ